MTDNTAGERMKEFQKRLAAYPGLTGFGVTWGPDAQNLTQDERADCLMRALDQVDAHQELPTEEKMRIDIEIAYTAIVENMDAIRGTSAFCALDMAALHLGNWLNSAARARARGRSPAVTLDHRED